MFFVWLCISYELVSCMWFSYLFFYHCCSWMTKINNLKSCLLCLLTLQGCNKNTQPIINQKIQRKQEIKTSPKLATSSRCRTTSAKQKFSCNTVFFFDFLDFRNYLKNKLLYWTIIYSVTCLNRIPSEPYFQFREVFRLKDRFHLNWE